MERFGVWTLVFLISIMVFGHVPSGFAQTQEDDSISGVSGQSVRANVLGASWTWTAPATGPVTFDTRGSDFGMLLTVSDGVSYLPIASNLDLLNLTFSSELRFTAQQGQTYSITAARADGSFGPGTIVLNWQASSVGGGSPVRADGFDSSTEISGVSGQSEGSNVGADKESGEPDHADNSGGASVWWTWTAPMTGSVTADTRGSEFDTLLAVYTGDSVDGLVEVTSNDDASSGGRQSEVGFRAQQHQTYHIAVDGFGGESGTIVLNWRLESTASPLRVEVFENPEPRKPSYVIAGRNGSLQYWKTSDGAVHQMLYESADGTASARVFYDEATGLPRLVLDQVSGNWMLIRENGDFVDFWLYDGDGNYQSGFSVFEDAGEFYYAEIVGLPVYAGKEIIGQLYPASASWSGHFSLQVEWGDLTNIQRVPPEIAALMTNLVRPVTDQQESAIPDSSRPSLAARQKPARYSGLISAFAILTPSMAVADEEEPTFSISKGLTRLGMGLFGAGLVAGTTPWVAAGAAAYMGGMFLRDVAEKAHSLCNEVDDALAEGMCSMAADFIAHEDDRGPIGYLRDTVAWAKEKTNHLRARVQRGKQAIKNVVSRLSSGTDLRDLNENPPISDDVPQPIDSPASGEAEGPNGIVEQLSGDIDPDGNITVVGDGVEILGDVSEDGTSVAAMFTWDGESGIAVGTVQPPAHDEFPLLGEAHYACPCGQWGEPRLNVEDPDDPHCTCGSDIRQELRRCAYSDDNTRRTPMFCLEDDGNTGRWLVSDVEARIIDRQAAITDEERRALDELTEGLIGKEGAEGQDGTHIGSAHILCLIYKDKNDPKEFQGLVHANDATKGGITNIFAGGGATLCASLALRPYERITYDYYHRCASWADPNRQAREPDFCRGHPSKYQDSEIYRFSCEEATLQHELYGQLNGCTAQSEAGTWCDFEWPNVEYCD